MTQDDLYRTFAIAYLNGSAGLELDLDDGDTDLRTQATACGLRIHRFKRSGILPRVQAVLGALRGIGPADLLDIGTGRGAFLWPFLEAFPHVRVTCAEILEHRRAMLRAVSCGGIGRLTVVDADGSRLPLADDSFDVSTALEVLEHQADPAPMAGELLRVSRRFVLASVPSRPDDNPEHLQLFTDRSLKSLFLDRGAASVSVSHVPGHLVAVIRT